MVHMAWQGPELGLEFLALPQGACDILIPSRFAGITSGKPIAPWTLIQDPSKLSDLPAPPGFEKKGKGKGKCKSGTAPKGKPSGIASFTHQEGKGKGSGGRGPDIEVRSGSIAIGRFGVQSDAPQIGHFYPEELRISTCACTSHMEVQGCCMVPNVLPSPLCDEMAGIVDGLLNEVLERLDREPNEAARKELRLSDLGSVHGEELRWDLKLPMNSQVRNAVEVMVQSMGSLIEDLVSRDAILAELACIVSDPGAKQQPLHADTLRIGSACAPSLTLFVPLQDTGASMGPTIVCQGTHNLESHVSLFKCEQVLMPQDVVVKKHGCLPAVSSSGTALVMNSNLLHCGGANLSEPMGGGRRRLFYVTFQTPGNTPDRSSFSLREELLEELHLSDFIGAPSYHPVDHQRKALLLASLRGDSAAMLEFGLLLQSRGDPGAVEYFRKAALNKNPKGFAHLADVFEQGKLGIPKDFEEATKLRKFGTMLETQLSEADSLKSA